MYFCFNDSKAKYSCKGVSKRTNAIDKDTYLSVLRSKATGSATNFRVLVDLNRQFVGRVHTTKHISQDLTSFTLMSTPGIIKRS